MTMEEFFPQKRRRLDILKPTLKRNAQNEKRISLLVSMPLEGDLTGLPDYIGNAFDAVGKENSAVDKAHVATELDAMNITLFQLEGSRSAEQKLTGALMSGFTVVRNVGKGDVPKNEVTLDFRITVPFRPAIWSWAGDYAGSTMFAEFEMTQQTIELAKANEEDEDDGQMELGEGVNNQGENDETPTMPAEQRAAVEEEQPSKPRRAAKKKAAKKAKKGKKR